MSALKHITLLLLTIGLAVCAEPQEATPAAEHGDARAASGDAQGALQGTDALLESPDTLGDGGDATLPSPGDDDATRGGGPSAGDSASSGDDSAGDSATAGEESASQADTSTPQGDATEPDTTTTASETATAWGVISGACGETAAALQSSGPDFLSSTYTFEDVARFEPGSLGAKPLTRYEDENAGGSSRCTEVMSMQFLIDCEGAEVLKTETEMVYDLEGKLADYLVDLGGVRVGVSVTRAYKGPVVDVYTLDDATELLEKKLSGIVEAQENVSEADSWERSMVHVWTLHPEWALIVEETWEALDSALKADHVVLVTVEQGSDYIVTDACHD